MWNNLPSGLLQHLWAEITLLIIWFAVPVIGTVLAVLVMVAFLMSRMGDSYSDPLRFSTKGLGRDHLAEFIKTPKLPSLAMALIFVFFFGGFGLFYLSVMIGFALSITTVLGFLVMLFSIRTGMVIEGVIWGLSVVTAVWLWKKKYNEIWYRVQ